MKLSKLALVAALACGSYAGNAFADQTNDIQQVGFFHGESACDCGQPACGCEAPAPSCDSGCESSCDSGCDSGCAASSCGGCDTGCGFNWAVDWLGLENRDYDDPWKLFDNAPGNWDFGGHLALGYTSAPLPLFNSRDDDFQLTQAWVYAEKALDTSNGFDIGGRIDYIYGTDGPDTQAFGIDVDDNNPGRGFDNDFDNGADYGHALPQIYFEAGYGDLSVKLGNFYTIIGYEVVPATGNFFFSHAYTFFNSEPFTHTGALATYNLSEDITLWSGYTLGWDSGFNDNGDAFLGGASVNLTDDLTVIWAATGGRLNDGLRFDPVNGTNERGYGQSIVVDYVINDNWEYIFQNDILDTEDQNGNTVRDTFGINQYLIRSINDCFSVAGRFEWYQSEGVFTNVGENVDVYALTLGLNYRPHANVVIRPEIRWDWVDGVTQVAAVGPDNEILEDNDDRQTTFGIDMVMTF